MEINEISREIIGAAIEVHRNLGPGLLESTYETCLEFEIASRGLAVERQYPVPLVYRGVSMECGYRIDLLVERQVVVEIKAVARLEPVHKAQMLTYLRLSGTKLGLLINFNMELVKDGIERVALDLPEPPLRALRPLR